MNILNKLSNWYFSKSALPYRWVLAMDSLTVFLSTLFVYQLFHGFSATVPVFWPLAGTSAVYLLFYVVGFRLFRTYSGVLRYSSLIDIQRTFCAVFTGGALTMLSRILLDLDRILLPIPGMHLAVAAILSALMMCGMRMCVKYLYDYFFSTQSVRRAFIYGVRAGGIAIGKGICSQKPSRYLLRGFISSQDDITGKTLLGVRVYEMSGTIVDTMKRQGVRVLLVSPLKSDAFRNDDAFQRDLIKAGIRIMMVPEAQEWDGRSAIVHSQIKEVDIEDLLPRDKIDVDMDSVGALLKGHTILITGAAGSIGSEMVRQIAVYRPKKLVLVDQAETPMHDVRLLMARLYPEIETETVVTSICKRKRMDALFRDSRPDYVFHAAAYKHVPMMEDNPSEAVQNNIDGTRVIADCAVRYGVRKFVMISTDKAVNPTNVMGCSKRICEIYVQSLDKAVKSGLVNGVTQFVTTRFGNVLGSNGSVIPIFRDQIRRGGPVTVTDPGIIRFFMLIPEACKLVLEAGTMGNGGEIFVFDMGKPVRIADLAQKMIDLSGARNVEITYTGLRDGEKLYEEVLNDAELTRPTFHPKIKIASVRDEDYASVCGSIDRLTRCSQAYDDMETVRQMKAMVPEYISRHSVYERLDA